MTRWVFGPCSIVSMRKQEDDTNLSEPFWLTSHDALVDDCLSWVVKVSKLSLPKSEVLRRFHCITDLIAHWSVLGQVWVIDTEASFCSLFHVWSVSERNKGTFIFLINNFCMSLRKSASFNILSWKSDIISILYQWSKCHCLCSCPVYWVLFYRLDSSLCMSSLQPVMKFEISWNFNTCIPNLD